MQAEPTADSAPRSGRRWLALIVLALLAAGLRLYRIELPGLTSDEAFSWRLSSYELQELMRRATGENGPPLYAVLLRLWSLGASDSATALRGLSALFGVLSVLAAFRLVRAALDGAASATSALAGTAAAALVAIHAGQVLQGRNARMYALGILLTASSGLLLLRCLREPRRIGPWLAYAVCAAAFLYVHYYAAFTLAAQGLFALADAMSRRSDARRLAATVRGLSAAGLVVLVLYLPWLPAMREQSQRLGEVPAAAASGLHLVPLWALGFRPPAGLAPLAVIGVLVVLGWAAAHGRAARFFLLQAALPWMIGVSWSLISGRAVLRDRYLVFAQFSLLCLIATVLAARRPGAWRAAGVAAAIALAGFGLSREARRLYPDEPHALVKATRFLGREAGPAAAWSARYDRSEPAPGAHAGGDPDQRSIAASPPARRAPARRARPHRRDGRRLLQRLPRTSRRNT